MRIAVATAIGPHGVNKSDRAMVAFALKHDCILVSDDHPLIGQAQKVGVTVKTTGDLAPSIAGWLSPRGGGNALARSRRSSVHGHYLARLILNAPLAPGSKFTVFDSVNRGWVYYESDAGFWVAELDGLPKMRARHPVVDQSLVTISLAYKLERAPGKKSEYDLVVGSSGGETSRNRKDGLAKTWLRRAPGDTRLASSRNGTDFLNGYLIRFSYGPGFVDTDTFKLLLADPNRVPSLFDADLLDAALSYIGDGGHRAVVADLI